MPNEHADRTKAKNEAAIPSRRFPEFESDPAWDFILLGDSITQPTNKGNAVKGAYVSTENLLPNFGGVDFSISNLPNTRTNIFKSGDILLSNIRIYLNKIWRAKQQGTCSNDIVIFRPTEKVLSTFLYYLLSHPDFLNYASKTSKGVKMPRGDKASLLAFNASIPSLAEQEKIAACLSSLDQLIEASEKKAELLKEHKKGLMRRLFPDQEDFTPRNRQSLSVRGAQAKVPGV